MSAIISNFFFIGISLFALAATLSLLITKESVARIVSHGGAFLGSLFILAFSIWFLVSEPGVLSLRIAWGLLPFSFSIDPLAALFMAVTGVLGVCASLYGISYMRHYERRYDLFGFGFFFNVLPNI